jgi:hypothetical protein
LRSSEQTLEAFRKLHSLLLTIVTASTRQGRVRALPVSPLQLARKAESLEEFQNLAIKLFGLYERPVIVEELPEYDPEDSNEEADCKLEASQKEWDNEVDGCCSTIAIALKRSGYYHSLARREGFEEFCSVIDQRISAEATAVVKLYPIKGCEFSCDRFEVAGFPVVRLTAAELGALGPSEPVCRDFFPDEQIDPNYYSKTWFIRTETVIPTTFNFLFKHLYEEIYDAQKASPIKASLIIDQGFIDGVLLLSLYNRGCFSIDRMFLCEPSWRRTEWPLPLSGPVDQRQPYLVIAGKQHAFEEYLTIGRNGLKHARASGNHDAIRTAFRRYLQATFTLGDVFSDWNATSFVARHERVFRLPDSERIDMLEDALLRYVFALEAICIGDGKDAIAEKVALSVALLVGREDDEKADVRSFIKKEAHKRRSDLAHGKGVRADLLSKPLPKLRAICQRALLVVLSIYAEDPTFDLSQLQELPVSSKQRIRVDRARQRIFNLIADDSPLSGN